jgi:hypothetical protein
MQLQNRNGVVNMAIMALVIGLILLSVGIYLSKGKTSPAASIQNENKEIVTPILTTTPSAQLKNTTTPILNIDKELEKLASDEKNIDSALNDKPIDVMSE